MTIVRDSFYINGEWVKATSCETLDVTSSGTGELYATIPAGTVEEANSAVEAAAAAFTAWSNTSPKERGEFLVRISEKLAERADEIALDIANEVGMPLHARQGHPSRAADHDLRRSMRSEPAEFTWEEEVGNSTLVREPVGVVAGDHALELPATPDRPRSRRHSRPAAPSSLKPSEVAPSTPSSSPTSSTKWACPRASSTW